MNPSTMESVDALARKMCDYAMRGAVEKMRIDKVPYSPESLEALCAILRKRMKAAVNDMVDMAAQALDAGMPILAEASLKHDCVLAGVHAVIEWQHLGRRVVVTDGPDRGIEGTVAEVVKHATKGWALPCYWIAGVDYPVPANMTEEVK